MKAPVVSLMCLLLVTGARATPVSDRTTGLGVGELPWEFTVRRADRDGRVTFEIARNAWGLGTCRASFTPGAAGAKALQGQPVRARLLRAAELELNGNFRMGQVSDVSQQGVAGIAFTADFADEFPGNPRHLWTIFETAKGRTAISCYTRATRFERWRPDFETVVKAVVIPR